MQSLLPVAAGPSRSTRSSRSSTVRSLLFSRVPKTPRVWEASLERIPTLFGKLVFVAKLFDDETGKYWHRGLAFLMDDEAVDRFVRHCHLTLFRRWLRMNASTQIDEFSSYFSSAEDQREQMLAAFATLEPHNRLVPPGSSGDELLMYLRSVDCALDCLYAVYGLTSDAQPGVAENRPARDFSQSESNHEGVLQSLRRGYAWSTAASARAAC